MECRAISTTRRHRTGAFTLTEVMIAMAIGGIVFAAVGTMTIYSARAFSSLYAYVDLDAYSRNTLDRLTRDIRSADSITTATTNSSGQIIQLIMNSDGGSNNLSYTYNSTNLTVVRTNGTEVTTVLTNCTAFVFTIFGDESISGTFDQFPATNGVNVRLVKVDWKCIRSTLNQTATESVQSAKVVRRKS